MTDQPVTAIIGMGPGLSAALARRFAAGGHRVVGFARTPGKTPPGTPAELRALDAADLAAIGPALADLGPVDVLIYNAYRATFAPPSQVDPAEVVADFTVNVAAPLAAAQAVLPGMRAAGRGAILFTGGGLALDPTGWLPAASLAIGKAGVRNLAQSLHAELRGSGVQVGTVTVAGAIAPGTAFDPDRIAQAYWDLARDPGQPWERLYTGA